MTRRITIARDGTVKLYGKPTRWRWTGETCVGWVLMHHARPARRFVRLADCRAYLAALTDEELRG